MYLIEVILAAQVVVVVVEVVVISTVYNNNYNNNDNSNKSKFLKEQPSNHQSWPAFWFPLCLCHR